MFSEHWSRKIYMNYLRLQQVICKFAECWLVTLLTLGSNDTGFLDCCWLMVRMMVVFLVVADSPDFCADDDGGRLLLLVFSARAANFTTRLFLIMPGGHKLLVVGTNGTNYTNWLLANLSTTTAATINTSCIIYSPYNYLSTHSYDVMIWQATSIKHMAFQCTLEISQTLTASSFKVSIPLHLPQHRWRTRSENIVGWSELDTVTGQILGVKQGRRLVWTNKLVVPALHLKIVSHTGDQQNSFTFGRPANLV